MASDNYPLQALLRLRSEIKRQREAELARKVADEAAAARALAVAEAALAAARRDLEQQRAVMARRRGATRAAELQRVAAYLRAVEDGLVALEERCQRCTRQSKAASEAVGSAQTSLAAAAGEEELVERDFQRWTGERREAARRRAEQELEDLLISRRRCRS